MKKENNNLYLFAIVSLVAVVGIVILILQSSGKMNIVSAEDVAGQVSSSLPASSLQIPLFIVDGSANADDVLMLTDMVTHLSTEGYIISNKVYLESEVEIATIENKVLIIVRNEEVVIVVPDAPSIKTRQLSTEIQSFVTTEYGTSVTEVAYSDATIDDLD